MFEIEKEILETHEVMLTVTIDDKTKQQEMKKAARKLARQFNIPGFRRGRAPYSVIKQYVGESAILDEALDDWLEQNYPKIIEEADIEPFGPGKLISRDDEPLTLKIRVPLEPTVELGDYRSLRVEWQEPEISDEEIAEELEKLRERYAVIEPVDRPAAWGDLVEININGTAEDNPILAEDEMEVVLQEDTPIIVPGIAEEIIGMEEGQEKTFTVTLPESEDLQPAELRGEEATFTVTLLQVYDRQLPDLDDAFALTVGNFDTLEALKENIRQRRYEAALEEARQDYRDKTLNALVEMAEIHYPPEMVTEEIHRLYHAVEQQFNHEQFSLDDLLKIQGKTKEQYYTELRPQAVQHIETGLAFNALMEAEEIKVTPEELKIIPEFQQAETAEERGQIAAWQLEQKGLERLEMIAKGKFVAEEEPAEEEPAEEAPEETAEA